MLNFSLLYLGGFTHASVIFINYFSRMEKYRFWFNAICFQRTKKKIIQYFHVLDKKLSLYSALITRIGLSVISGLNHTELCFYYSSNHKPLFLSNPKYDFSISHSNGSIISCISANSPVGADVEKYLIHHLILWISFSINRKFNTLTMPQIWNEFLDFTKCGHKKNPIIKCSESGLLVLWSNAIL